MSPVVMHHFQAVPFENKIYVLDAFSDGGFSNQTPMANIYMYDTQKMYGKKERHYLNGERGQGLLYTMVNYSW